MGTIIVALLAFTMTILPITMPRAAGHQHAIGGHAGHEHAAGVGDHVHVPASPGDAVAVAPGDRHEASQDCAEVVCCSMSTCHAFQVSAAPDLHSPAVSRAPMAMPGDEQIAGLTPGGLDRPPRTV